MDFETASAEDFGRSLRGVGINLLSNDVKKLAEFLRTVFELTVHRLSDDFAIVSHDGMLIQLHADATYGAHPLLGIVPENPPRGGAAQFYLFGIDPDQAILRADAGGYVVLELAADKPHGLREGTILSPEGFAFSPAIVKA